jgi:hypothetical protein
MHPRDLQAVNEGAQIENRTRRRGVSAAYSWLRGLDASGIFALSQE